MLPIPKVVKVNGFIFNFSLYFIDYAITVVLIFPICPLHPAPHTPTGKPHILVHVHGSCV